MSSLSEMTEIIPGLVIGCAGDVEKMVLKGADVLVPLEYLNGSIWNTKFRGEILYYPIGDEDVLPDDVMRSLVDNICSRLDDGKKVGVFCGSGHGRTGYIAACVLARHGIKDPVGYLQRNYSPKAFETEKQVNEALAYTRSLRAEQINAEGLGEHFFEYYSYRGGDPYIYLSFSEWDDDTAPETVRILNEMGYKVAYDRTILEGRLWSGSRSDAIENCSLFVTIRTPCEWGSHIRDADTSFAELLEKPMVFIEMNMKNAEYLIDDDDFVVGIPSDPDFADKCRKAFKLKGMLPSAVSPDAADGEGRPVRRKLFKPKREWDLGVTYYEHYGDGERAYKHERQRDCNLRTREAFNWRHERLDPPSDEELYRAIGWKIIRFDLFPRSSGHDYFGLNEEDRAFRRRLCSLGGKRVPEISREYKAAQKKIDDYWRDYPYMDEFEYVDSKFDD